MSELKVNKISPRSGTTVTIGDSGDTTNIVGTLNNNGATLLSLANGVDNRVITSSSATALNGEANLTFDGSTLGVNGAAIFNESGADKDFRVESDGNAHMLFVDGGTNRVGIGTSGPTSPLMVQSNDILILHLKGANDKQMVVETTGGSTQITSYQLKNSAYSWQIENGRSANTFTIRASTGGERVRIDASGNFGIGTTAPSQKLDVVGSIEVSDGIYIGGTAAANKLEDYEEGTFTPAITVATGSVTNATQTGNYTKIGRLCYFDIRVILSAISSPSGALNVAGLPFTGGVGGRSGLVKFTTVNNFSSITQADVLGSYIGTATQVAVTNDAGAGYNASNLTATTQFDLSGVYQTN